MFVMLKNDKGVQRKIKKGFSWTTLFFGPLVPLFRGDILGLIVALTLEIIVGVMTAGLGAIAIWLVMPIFYNSWHISRLQKKGWKIVSA